MASVQLHDELEMMTGLARSPLVNDGKLVVSAAAAIGVAQPEVSAGDQVFRPDIPPLAIAGRHYFPAAHATSSMSSSISSSGSPAREHWLSSMPYSSGMFGENTEPNERSLWAQAQSWPSGETNRSSQLQPASVPTPVSIALPSSR